MRRPMRNNYVKSPKANVEELASLARLIVYARQTAKDLEIDFPTYLLDLAHGAVVEEIQAIGGEVSPANWHAEKAKGKAIN